MINKKKCPRCGEVKPLAGFSKDRTQKSGLHSWCKVCASYVTTKWRNTEKGYLKTRYLTICSREKISENNPVSIKCHFTFNEFCAAFEKHVKGHGMKSAWGPGIDKLEQHLPITMIQEGKGQFGRGGNLKGSKRIASNLSADRLDSSREYTLQNIIFIRNDENTRKHRSSYNDCLIQVRLYKERFIDMKAI